MKAARIQLGLPVRVTKRGTQSSEWSLRTDRLIIGQFFTAAAGASGLS
jgi:hypothetical protein